MKHSAASCDYTDHNSTRPMCIDAKCSNIGSNFSHQESVVNVVEKNPFRNRYYGMSYKWELQSILAICFLILIILVICFNKQTTKNHISVQIVRNGHHCNYVGLKPGRNRLGNHLFYYVGTMYVAWLTNRRPCVWTKSKSRDFERIDKVFNVDIEHVDIGKLGCRIHKFKQNGVYVYDSRVESLVNVAANKSLRLEGAFASWKYASPIETQLRRQLRFRHELAEFVADFLSRSVPPGWSTMKFVRVGVHVRRGDFLGAWARSKGFTVAGERYLKQAMGYFVERFARVQFIVASNDIRWCRAHIKSSWFNKSKVNITFSVKHDTGQDLALLANCDHSIMTTGTFSWWAAWLANGITVYYTDFPKPGSILSGRMRSKDFFRPDWIGMNDKR